MGLSWLIDVNRVKSKKSLEYYDFIQDKLSSIYSKVNVGKNEYFYNKKDNCYFKVTVFPVRFNALVIEYAYGLIDAENNCFEDGDLHYVDEMTKEEMLDEMIEEIER